MDDVKVEVKNASELLNMFFQDIGYILDPILRNAYPEELAEAKNRVSDFISNYGDSLFMVDVEEVSGRTMFLRRSLFEITKEDKSRIGVFMNMLGKNIVITTVNEKNDQKKMGPPGEYDQGADTQFIIDIRSLVNQVYDRFCTKEGE